MTPKLRTGEFLLNKLENYMLLMNLGKAEQMITECAKYIPPGTNLWFNLEEFHFLLLMNTSNFNGANTIYEEAILHDRFAVQKEHIRE